jgi:hypothetical protein
MLWGAMYDDIKGSFIVRLGQFTIQSAMFFRGCGYTYRPSARMDKVAAMRTMPMM